MTRYEGPVFDVQAHAVNPGALAWTSAGIRAAAHLAEGTKQIIIGDVLATAADDLNGERRLSALKGDNHQVVSINLFFPALAPDLLLGIAEQTNSWLAQRASENDDYTRHVLAQLWAACNAATRHAATRIVTGRAAERIHGPFKRKKTFSPNERVFPPQQAAGTAHSGPASTPVVTQGSRAAAGVSRAGST